MKKVIFMLLIVIQFFFTGCSKDLVVTPDNDDPYSKIILPEGKEYHSHMKLTQFGGRKPKVLFNTDYNFDKWNCQGLFSPKVHFNLNQSDGDSLRLDYLIIWNSSTRINNLFARYELYCDSTIGNLNRYDIEIPFSWPIGSRGWIARSQTIPTSIFNNQIGPYGLLGLVDDGTIGEAGFGAGIRIRLCDEFNSEPMVLLEENIFAQDYYESPIYTIHSKKLIDKTSSILIDGKYTHRFQEPTPDDQVLYKVWDANDNLLTTAVYYFANCSYGPDTYQYYWNNISQSDFLSYISPENVYKIQMIIERPKKNLSNK